MAISDSSVSIAMRFWLQENFCSSKSIIHFRDIFNLKFTIFQKYVIIFLAKMNVCLITIKNIFFFSNKELLFIKRILDYIKNNLFYNVKKIILFIKINKYYYVGIVFRAIKKNTLFNK